jgi:hypothetical protein
MEGRLSVLRQAFDLIDLVEEEEYKYGKRFLDRALFILYASSMFSSSSLFLPSSHLSLSVSLSHTPHTQIVLGSDALFLRWLVKTPFYFLTWVQQPEDDRSH